METKEIRFAMYIALSLGAIFLIANLLNFEHLAYLRFLNIFIVAGFSNALAKSNFLHDKTSGYLTNLSSIFLANLIATVVGVLGFVLFAGVIKPTFLNEIQGGMFMMNKLTLGQATAGLFLEGIAGSAITAFILMQIWKDDKKVSSV